MVHLCNIKMSAVSTRHKSNGKQYDIDGFISQLLATRKFEDLAEKLAEKAANKIVHIAAPSPVKRATDDNEVDNSTESYTQKVNYNQSNREYANKYEENQLNNVKLRKDFTGKINPQAVINATNSLSENLQLKYKYFKKNALEKKVKSNRDPLPKNDTKEDPSKHNKSIGPVDFIDHNNKKEERTSNLNATQKNQNYTIKKPIGENKRSQDDTKDDERKEYYNRQSELNESYHSGSTDGETNDSSKKPGHSHEERGPGQEHTIFRGTQNSGPEHKGIVEQEANQVNGIRDKKPSSLDEENQKNLTPSKENNNEDVEKDVGVPVKRGMGEINEDENVIAQFRAREDSIEDNKMNSDYNPHVGVYKTRASDDSGDHRSKEQSPDQRSKEQSPEDQRSKEQSSGDQSSKEQSSADPNSSKLQPLIRKEGNKLYTYVKAPEYEDYYEKLAKLRKHHPENHADFII